MGRPRKIQPRSHQLNLSLTEAELESIRMRAEAVGMRPVHFGRAMLLDTKRVAALGDAKTASNWARLLYGQLARLGNNLNQMVRHCYRGGEPLPPDLEPLLADIRQIIVEMRHGMPR